MKIKSVKINRRKKLIEIEVVKKGLLSMPFSRMRLKPTAKNPIQEAFVDPELGSEAVTYILRSGAEDSLHIDAFLDCNKDPDFLRDLLLYQLTVQAQGHIEKSHLSKNEIARRLKTSPSQLARLLDQKNSSKTVDNMLRLLAVIGCDVELKVRSA